MGQLSATLCMAVGEVALLAWLLLRLRLSTQALQPRLRVVGLVALAAALIQLGVVIRLRIAVAGAIAAAGSVRGGRGGNGRGIVVRGFVLAGCGVNAGRWFCGRVVRSGGDTRGRLGGGRGIGIEGGEGLFLFAQAAALTDFGPRELAQTQRGHDAKGNPLVAVGEVVAAVELRDGHGVEHAGLVRGKLDVVVG